MSKVFCDYCDKKALLVDSAEVYNGRSYGMIWICRPCHAYVGVHKGTRRPLGRLANASLRKHKIAAHAAFDPIWKGRGGRARRRAYKWLAGKLGIPGEKCHIGMFDEEMCQKVVEVCSENPDSR